MEIKATWEKGLSEESPARTIRKTVFQDEQGFVDEFDEIDQRAWHLVLYDEAATPMACGRVFPPDTAGETLILGRLAVLKEYRGQRLGARAVLEIEQKAKTLGAGTIRLSAQCRVRRFYESLGYAATGDPYDEEGCPHISMEKTL